MPCIPVTPIINFADNAHSQYLILALTSVCTDKLLFI